MKLLLIALLLPACTTVRENGKTVFLTGANAGHLVYRSPAGSYLEIDKLDHAIIHRTVFNGVGYAAGGIGAAIATSGIKP